MRGFIKGVYVRRGIIVSRDDLVGRVNRLVCVFCFFIALILIFVFNFIRGIVYRDFRKLFWFDFVILIWFF